MVPVSSARVFRWMPIFARSEATDASWAGNGSAELPTENTSWHALASQTPSWFVSYFDCIISALALVRSPRLPGVAYGLYVAGSAPDMDGGAMCVATRPKSGPPRSRINASLLMIQLTALRTWMSSNGGTWRFMAT